MVVARALERGVKGFLIVGYDLESSERAIELAEYLPWSYAAVGIHPHDAKEFKEEDLKVLEEMAAHERVRAIGEIGLDYYRNYSPQEDQRRAFRAQLELAKHLEMPVVLHVRKAFPDVFKILQEVEVTEGVFHCFSGGIQEAQKAVELGFYVSFAGSLTYGSRKLEKALKGISRDRILLETDAPYLAPGDYRGQRNEPAYLVETAKKVAEVLGVTLRDVATWTFQNALRFLALPERKTEDAVE